MNQQVVIVGGGFAGLNAARQLKDAPVDITLIDRRNHHLFQPLLYQVATGELSPADIATPLRRLLKRQRNARVLLAEVTDFDVANKQVILRNGTLKYDTLIVAAGSGNHYFGNEQWSAWAPSLKSVEDATEIRRRILAAFEAAESARDRDEVRAWLTFVIVGGGPTGVEMAGALAEIAFETLRSEFRAIDPAEARIVLVQSPERILPTYPEALSDQAARVLERRGVDILTGARVVDVRPNGVTLKRGQTQETIPARTILWTAGVKASPLGDALARATGAEVDRAGRVIVAPDLSLPGHPDVFVLGDLARFAHQGEAPLPGVAQVAIQQGRYVARLIARRLTGQDTPAFHYRDRGDLATIGRGAAVADLRRVRFSGLLAWLVWVMIHLVMQAEAENRMLVFMQWAWNFVTRGRSAMLITDRQTDQPGQDIKPRRWIYDTGIWPRVG